MGEGEKKTTNETVENGRARCGTRQRDITRGWVKSISKGVREIQKQNETKKKKKEKETKKKRRKRRKRAGETDSSELVVLSGGMVTFVNTYIRFNLRRNPVRTTVLGKFFLPVHHGACLAGLLAFARVLLLPRRFFYFF